MSKWTLITAAEGPSGFDPVLRAEDAGSPVSTFLHAQHTTSSDEHVFLSRQSEKTPIPSSPSYLLRAACARVSAAAGAHVGPDASAAVQTLQLTASWGKHDSRPSEGRSCGRRLANLLDTHGSDRACPASRGRSGRRWRRRTRLRLNTSADSWLRDRSGPKVRVQQ